MTPEEPYAYHVHAWKEDRFARFIKAIADGATLAAHPDTLAELTAKLPPGATAAGVLHAFAAFEIRTLPNKYLEPGMLYTIPPPPTREELIRKFSEPFPPRGDEPDDLRRLSYTHRPWRFGYSGF